MATNCLCVFDHFVKLALKGLKTSNPNLSKRSCSCWNKYDCLLEGRFYEGPVKMNLKLSLTIFPSTSEIGVSNKIHKMVANRRDEIMSKHGHRNKCLLKNVNYFRNLILNLIEHLNLTAALRSCLM